MEVFYSTNSHSLKPSPMELNFMVRLTPAFFHTILRFIAEGSH